MPAERQCKFTSTHSSYVNFAEFRRVLVPTTVFIQCSFDRVKMFRALPQRCYGNIPNVSTVFPDLGSGDTHYRKLIPHDGSCVACHAKPTGRRLSLRERPRLRPTYIDFN